MFNLRQLLLILCKMLLIIFMAHISKSEYFRKDKLGFITEFAYRTNQMISLCSSQKFKFSINTTKF